MKIFNKETIFNEIIVGDCFLFETYYYMKLQQFSFFYENDHLKPINAVSLDNNPALEHFDKDEQVTPVNLVGVIDYEHNS